MKLFPLMTFCNIMVYWSSGIPIPENGLLIRLSSSRFEVVICCSWPYKNDPRLGVNVDK
ncbi:hypothetical protein AGABI2DRAFT_190144 [Agaricus bisporus var. bisporus H97]|uniref:hypothetical protein n=1 Tax=Agaricus bisporus var. bisporus (strain H97 / ATCC MYA-4626 / FGSC 10389) TaxID=936046 RepID=UPI00029F6926|nr:hypothetical protein AGABI2DRAFT_190144 [Agaricus bisporus var. bisporus H97]EKV49660.1 hypothetical protein AGABI2DRAFT_190144 [Agaricus bisporus var. bisporus H97]